MSVCSILIMMLYSVICLPPFNQQHTKHQKMGGVTTSLDVSTSSGGIYKKKGSKGGGGSSVVGLDVSDKSGISRDDLLEENVRLTQLLMDVSLNHF